MLNNLNYNLLSSIFQLPIALCNNLRLTPFQDVECSTIKISKLVENNSVYVREFLDPFRVN